MKSCFDWDNMNEKADGVDFVPIFSNIKFPTVYASYTKEEIKSVKAIPKSGRRYWVIKEGRKEYID